MRVLLGALSPATRFPRPADLQVSPGRKFCRGQPIIMPLKSCVFVARPNHAQDPEAASYRRRIPRATE